MISANSSRTVSETRSARCWSIYPPAPRAPQIHSTVTPASTGPNSDAVSCSTACSTFSACTLSGETVTAANTARCHRSWQSISATETLNLLCSRSRRLFTTCRFSFSEWEFSSRNSSVNTPMEAMCDSRAPSREYFRRYLFRNKCFDDVACLDIAVVFEGYAAFHPAAHLAYVVLKPAQGADLPGMNHHVIAQQADIVAAFQLPILYETSRHHADLADAERIAHFGFALINLFEYRREQASHGEFNLVREVVNDGVQPDVDLFFFGHRFGVAFRPDI